MASRNLLVYDNLQVAGGAEFVTRTMLNNLSCGHLLVNYAEPKVLKQLGIPQEKVTTLSKPVNSVPLSMLSSAYQFWRYRNQQELDTVIVSGIFAPLIVPNIRARKIIYYCHTPPRFLYDLREYYRQELTFPAWQFLQGFAYFYGTAYRQALNKIDVIVANSQNVQNRLKTFLGVESRIVYPPCDTSYQGKKSHGYFLSTARVEPYKRVDLIVDAFMRMPDKNLVVMSGGSMLEALKEKAKACENISFTGWVDESEKRKLIAHCEATIYIPKDEDFGISPIESLSAHKPVIGVAEGGLLETVRHQKTGLLCDKSRLSEDLMNFVRSSELRKLPLHDNHYSDFSESVFVENMLHICE